MRIGPVPRRPFLRAAGTIVGLPALESLGFRRHASAAAPNPARPKRAVFLGFGWGVTEESWMPDRKVTGKNYQLPSGLAPLARHQADFTVVQGLSNKFANEAHWGSTFWLTGGNRYSEPGRSFSNSISVDQGFGLENFDAAGKWRTEDTYQSGGGNPKSWPVDPAAAFHNGPAFKDFHELRDLVAARSDAFARGFTEALIEYALGRPFGFVDDDTATTIVDRAKAKDWSLGEFVHALVASEAFRSKSR